MNTREIERIRRINLVGKMVEGTRESGVEIDTKKLKMEIMKTFGVSSRTAQEYLEVGIG